MKYVEVVAAVIQRKDGKIYCAQRNGDGELALKWEFPGGKIEQGETHQEALIREIQEEFSTDVIIKDYITTVKHQYINFHLTLHAYYAEVSNGDLVLNEHADFKWLLVDELDQLDWAAADIPVVELLKR
ncbi:(deoxy)nucleoside triphosphate pyrophosphohydrolase [Liberiplasma polymorphum]|uniref:(deoxy)nucleoside triphosphate pyrophosphohydrolase n=1 Tax=Liberiplasma polymorphum TaxID=3374570 RepID=UPI003770A282